MMAGRGKFLRFELGGHRGAGGLRRENPLPGCGVAFDWGVPTVESDVHLTADGIPVVCHDANVSDRLCRVIPGSGAVEPRMHPSISSLTLAHIRQYRADVNPDASRFPEQDNQTTPLALWFAQHHGIDAFTPPMLAALFAFATAYAGDPGRMVGKTGKQQAQAGRVRFDLELKRVPFRPTAIGEGFDGTRPTILEQRVIQAAREANMLDRICFRSFDHRCVRILGELAPGTTQAILPAGTAPVAPADL